MGGFFGLIEERCCQYAQYLAWLAVAPDNPNPKAKKPVKQRTRREKYEGSLIEPDGSIASMIEDAMECGLSTMSGDSVNPVSWQEIRAWANTTNREGIWYLGMIKKISESYVGFIPKAREPACPPPVMGEADEAKYRQSVADQLKRAMGNGRHRQT